MNNIKCVERTFYFGRVNPSSVEYEPDDIFADWKVTFRLISSNKFECDITSFKLSMTHRGPVSQSENEMTEELARKYLNNNYKRIHHLAGIRDKQGGYPITEELNKTSKEFEEYMRGYNNTKNEGTYE